MVLGNAFLGDEWRGQGMLALSSGDGLTSGGLLWRVLAVSDLFSLTKIRQCLISCLADYHN